jgi:hypothetical protein
MAGPSPGELLAAARQRVSGARAMLADPRTCNLPQCTVWFQDARTFLEQVCEQLAAMGAPGPELRQSATALSREIRHTGALLEQAARWGRRWLAALATQEAAYTAAGQTPPLPPRTCISVLG